MADELSKEEKEHWQSIINDPFAPSRVTVMKLMAAYQALETDRDRWKARAEKLMAPNELLSALDTERERADRLENSNTVLDLTLDNEKLRLSVSRDMLNKERERADRAETRYKELQALHEGRLNELQE